MSMRRFKRQRRGAVALEMAITLMAFLLLTFGMLDLGIGMFRYHVLSQAARHGARQASVHGEMADLLGPWGPGTIDVTATSDDPIVSEVAARLIGCDLDRARVKAEWLDDSNSFSARVRVTVSAPYEPLFSWIFPNGEVALTASSTMRIAH